MPETNGTQDNTQSDRTGTTQEAGGETQQASWEDILATLPEETQALYSTHVQGLRSALDSERQAHKDLERQVREAAHAEFHREIVHATPHRTASPGPRAAVHPCRRRHPGRHEAGRHGVDVRRLPCLRSRASKEDAQHVLEILTAMDRVLGLLEDEKAEIDTEIEALIAKRQEARKNRDWATADMIRDQLAAQGIVLEDTRDGVRWKRT